MLDHRIKTFLTLYNELNYRKTAEILNMTQPGVTQHIKYLENLYDIKLFEYRDKQLHKTRCTEIFKGYVDSMIAHEKDMLEKFSQDNKVVLNIGATRTISECIFPSITRDFLTNSSHCVNITVSETPALIKKVQSGELDFAILEGVFDKVTQPHHLFREEKFVGICNANHRFANKTVPIEETFKETLLFREKGSGNYLRVDQAMSAKGYSENNYKRFVQINDFSLITSIVANSDCIAIAYSPVALLHENLTTFEIEGLDIPGEFNFVYSNRNIAEEKIKLFFGDWYDMLPDKLY